MTNTPNPSKAEQVARTVENLRQAADGAPTPKGNAAYRDFNRRGLQARIADEINGAPTPGKKMLILKAARLAVETAQEMLNPHSQRSVRFPAAGSVDPRFCQELTTGEAREALDAVCLHEKSGSWPHRWLGYIAARLNLTHYSRGAGALRRFLDTASSRLYPQPVYDGQGGAYFPAAATTIPVGAPHTLKVGALPVDLGREAEFMTVSEIGKYYRKFCYFSCARAIQRQLPAAQQLMLVELDRIVREHPGVKNWIAAECRHIDEVSAHRPVRAKLSAQFSAKVLGALATVAESMVSSSSVSRHAT